MVKKPNIKNAGLKFKYGLTPINKSKVDKLVQHHMAHKSWGIKDVHNYHINGNGWNGIGYNFWIDFKGNIYQGRGFNVGAHVGGHNSHTIGIGYQGDFTKQKMPDAQLKSGMELNKWLIDQLPNVSKNDIIGHRDLASTSCPGQNFRMSELIKGVGGKSVKPSKTSTTKPSKSKNKANLTVDGKWGKSTTRALQKALGTPVDGIISKQPRNSVSQSLYGGTVHFGSGGSNVIVALQKKIKVNADGKLGPATIRSLQKHLGTPEDGVLSRPSVVVKELQRRLNKGTL